MVLGNPINEEVTDNSVCKFIDQAQPFAVDVFCTHVITSLMISIISLLVSDVGIMGINQCMITLLLYPCHPLPSMLSSLNILRISIF